MSKIISQTKPMWGIVSVSIKNIFELRNQFNNNEENGFLNMSLNANLILNFAAFIEGSLKDILKSYLDSPQNENEKRKNEYFKKLLSKEGIDKLKKELFEPITGFNIKNIVPEEANKAIEKLMQLRNIIIHGNSFNLVFTAYKFTSETFKQLKDKNIPDEICTKLKKQLANKVFNHKETALEDFEKDIKTVIGEEKFLEHRTDIVECSICKDRECLISAKYKDIYKYFITHKENIIKNIEDEKQYSSEYLFQNSVTEFLLKNLCIFMESILKLDNMPNNPKYYIEDYLRQYIKPLLN